MVLLKYLLCLIPFFKPFYISQFNVLNQIYNILQIFIAFFIIINFIKNKKLSKPLFFILVLEGILFISSFMNGLNLSDTIKNLIQTITLCMLIENFINTNPRKLFLALKIIFSILVIIDFIFVLKYPTGIRIGLYNVWFFGAKNSQIVFILPALFVIYIYNFVMYKSNKWKLLEFLILLIISFYILFMVDSVTSIVVMLLFFILLLLHCNNWYKSISMKTISIIYFILFLSLTVFQFQNYFSDFFVNVLEKDVTFTGRTIIWEDTMEYIIQQPILGYGLEPSQIRVVKLNDRAALNSHNMILEILYNGGILLFIIFLLFWKYLCQNVDNFSKNNSPILKSILIVYLVELMFEVLAFEQILWILVLINYLSKKGGEILNVTK